MKTLPILLLCLPVVFIFACKKKPSAGLGGAASLTVDAYHHTQPIDSCTVYIKFNASEAPADGEYDLVQPLTKNNGSSTTVFEGLKAGDYYVFAKGWDPAIAQMVKGGIPYTIKTETELKITVPVTEE